MKKLLVLLLASTPAAAQDSTIRKMDEVLIYSHKFLEKRKNIVQKIDLITASRAYEANLSVVKNSRTLAMKTFEIGK